ncbi:MAG: DMT family transporter [Longimicrobiales bacterium]
MDTASASARARPLLRGRAAGYLLAMAAGALWGTTGPLSTALYAEGAAVTDVGFWRIAVATAGFLLYATFRPGLLRVDRRGVVLVGGAGGAFVALFEVAYQFAIAQTGVASAVALLYLAPVLVTLLARPLLGERLTVARLLIAVVVTLGAALTVMGAHGAAVTVTRVGVIGGVLSAAAWASQTLLARWAVPRYGMVKVLFLALAGGVGFLAIVLPLAGHAPTPPVTAAAWSYIAALGFGTVIANFLFFAGLRRIDAAPASIAATAEPVVAAVLALVLFGQALTIYGWVGLSLVVAGVAEGYRRQSIPS